ncbi:hypothetical protein I5I01_gp69 [Mycobacterium phage MooMoo]|uniref:DNA-binding phage zinc finger domain-containing protein n=1 Tax=Mycobacterium phage MooMoo TaxID=2108127 RepID=A0A2P1JRA4_9CAUD|nr:hypothetical protein I5I01_gp69 [Mycobacterium phage MooMoo]AVO21674.1 hypothetical protein SEA_MOOMOO_69 [Mycobacterium phage MooMoo]
MNRDEVVDVLSVVAAATRRTVGHADVEVWQGVIGDLPKDLALQAIRDHLRHKPGVWLEPGHVYEGARAIRRDQLARETAEEREARQAALDAKAAEDRIEAITAGAFVPKFTRPDPQKARELSVRCPYCRAGVGKRCFNHATGRERGSVHPARLEVLGG